MVDKAFKLELDAYVDEVWEQLLEDIDSLLRVPSVADPTTANNQMPWGEGPARALEAALAIAARLGLSATNDNGFIGYADLQGTSDAQIATIAHCDVVPTGEGWTVDPWRLTRKEGYLLGRGVLDDKGPLILSFYAAHFFKRLVERTGTSLPYTLRCIIGAAEETTMEDVDYYLRNYEQPTFCFTPDAEFPLICGEKGLFHGTFRSEPVCAQEESRILELSGGTVANAVPGQASALVRAELGELPAATGISAEAAGEGLVRLFAEGIGGHASKPEGTRNAIGMLADYLLEQAICSQAERRVLELLHELCSVATNGENLGIACTDDLFGPLTLIGGTVKLADGRIEQTVDSRFPQSTTAAQIEAALTDLAAQYGCSFSLDGAKEPFYMDPELPEIQALLTSYREYSGDMTDPMVIGGGTYARKFKRACAFGPNTPEAQKPEWVGPEHGANEGIAEELMQRALKIYILSIARLMELAE